MEEKWVVMVLTADKKIRISEPRVYGVALAKYRKTSERCGSTDNVRLMKIVSEVKDGLQFPDHGFNG